MNVHDEYKNTAMRRGDGGLIIEHRDLPFFCFEIE